LFGRGQGVQAVEHGFIVHALGGVPGDGHKRPWQVELVAIVECGAMLMLMDWTIAT
jgi:hypothetical protein